MVLSRISYFFIKKWPNLAKLLLLSVFSFTFAPQKTTVLHEKDKILYFEGSAYGMGEHQVAAETDDSHITGSHAYAAFRKAW